MRLYSEYLPWLKNILLNELATSRSDGAAITWPVHRHTTVFGFYPCSARDVIASLSIF